MGMVTNDAHESEDNKSCIICKDVFKKLLDFFIRILILDHKSNMNKNASKALSCSLSLHLKILKLNLQSIIKTVLDGP